MNPFLVINKAASPNNKAEGEITLRLSTNVDLTTLDHSLQFRTVSNQGLACFVSSELLEVLDETIGQIFRFLIPLSGIGIGIADRESSDLHRAER